MTSVQHDPSANSPWTSTMLRALVGFEGAAMPRVETSEAVALANMAREKSRRFIVDLRLRDLRFLAGQGHRHGSTSPATDSDDTTFRISSAVDISEESGNPRWSAVTVDCTVR